MSRYRPQSTDEIHALWNSFSRDFFGSIVPGIIVYGLQTPPNAFGAIIVIPPVRSHRGPDPVPCPLGPRSAAATHPVARLGTAVAYGNIAPDRASRGPVLGCSSDVCAGARCSRRCYILLPDRWATGSGPSVHPRPVSASAPPAELLNDPIRTDMRSPHLCPPASVRIAQSRMGASAGYRRHLIVACRASRDWWCETKFVAGGVSNFQVVPPQNVIRQGDAIMKPQMNRLKRGGARGLSMAQSDPTSSSGARGSRCGLRSPPPSSCDPAALKSETFAVRSMGSIAVGLPFPILAAMAADADPCSGRNCLARGTTTIRPHAPPKVQAPQARWPSENRCRDSKSDQPHCARQCALERATHPRRIADAWLQRFPRQYRAIYLRRCVRPWSPGWRSFLRTLLFSSGLR
jgi:hypothetical protein